MDEVTDIDLLEQYIRGELSTDAVAALELRLEKDIVLAKQLVELREVQEGIRYALLTAQLEEIRSWEVSYENVDGHFEQDVSEVIKIEKHRELLGEIQSFEKELLEKEVKVRKIRHYWWGVAAGILLLLGAVLFLFQPEKQLTNEELFVMYFEPYPIIGIERGNTEEIDRLKAYNLYEKGDFEELIAQYESHERLERENLDHFYYAVALLGNKDYEKATLEFSRIRDSGNYSILDTQISWYLLLGNLAMNNHNATEEILNKNDLGRYEKKAEEINIILKKNNNKDGI